MNEELQRRFAPLREEIERRGGRIEVYEVKDRRLFLRAEMPTPDDFDAIWDLIKQMDPDLAELEPQITIREGASLRQERPSKEPAEQAEPEKRPAGERVRRGGGRGAPSGPTT